LMIYGLTSLRQRMGDFPAGSPRLR